MDKNNLEDSVMDVGKPMGTMLDVDKGDWIITGVNSARWTDDEKILIVNIDVERVKPFTIDYIFEPAKKLQNEELKEIADKMKTAINNFEI